MPTSRLSGEFFDQLRIDGWGGEDMQIRESVSKNSWEMSVAGTATEMTRAQTEEQRTETARSVIFFLFFISGFAALMYQIVWQRALFAIYGINVESVTVVVSAFMLGLGLGSLLGGYVSTLGIPLVPVFGAAELGTAAFGFISLHLFKYVAVYTAGANTLATGVLAFALVLIPTILMGSTLPILVTYCVRTIPNMGRWTGALYYVNTLGSAIACIIAAIFAMRLLAESGCVGLAACINTVVGVTALAFYYHARPTDSVAPLDRAPLPPQQPELLPFGLGVVVAGASGVIALAYEIIWYRVFSFSTATRSQTFGYVLGLYLVGIAFGALVAERICRNTQDGAHQRRTAGLLIVIGNLIAFAIAPVVSYCTQAFHSPIPGFIFVPIGALLLGTVFPLICHLTIRPDARAGSRMSHVYFSNIIGSTLGSFVVGYLLMDFMSTAQVSIMLVTCGTLLGLILLLWKDGSQWKLALGLALVCVVVTALIWPSFATMYQRLLLDYPAARFEYLIENRSGVVGVLADRTVIGGGAYDGRFNTDPLHDTNGIFRAYALSALHPAPRDVLMIGLSSGSWAQVIANNPDVEHLIIVEINPGYLSLIPRYAEVRSLLSNPKVTVDIDDGRRWLRRNPGLKFDAVVMNTTFHWRASTTNLLSTEFLQLVHQHLKLGGIFYYNTTESPEAQVTGASLFPYAVRVWNFMALSDSPIVVNKQRLLDVMREYAIDGHQVLVPANAAANQSLLDKYSTWIDQAHGNSAAQMIEYGDTLLTRYKGRTIITDDNMACEWRD